MKEAAEPGVAQRPFTTCALCEEVTAETLTDHLARAHLNQMLHIETDPSTGVSVIHGAA